MEIRYNKTRPRDIALDSSVSSSKSTSRSCSRGHLSPILPEIRHSFVCSRGSAVHFDSKQGRWRCISGGNTSHAEAIQKLARKIHTRLESNELKENQAVDVNWGYLTNDELARKVQDSFGVYITRAESEELGNPFLVQLEDANYRINGVQFLQKVFQVMAETNLKNTSQKSQSPNLSFSWLRAKQSSATKEMKRGVSARKKILNLSRSQSQNSIESTKKDVPSSADPKKAKRQKALKKLEYAAERHLMKPVNLKHIREGGAMSPQRFQTQMMSTFGLNLNHAEIDALMEVFDLDGDGSIDSAEFLSLFFRMADNIRKSRLEQQRLHAHQKKQNQEKDEARFRSRAATINNEFEIEHFSEEDVKKAVAKLAKVAADYDRHSMGTLYQLGFEGPSLSASEFRSQLRNAFHLKLSVKETSALVKFLEKGMAIPAAEPASNSGGRARLSSNRNSGSEAAPYEPGRVDGHTFGVVFRRLGQTERENRRKLREKEARQREVRMMEADENLVVGGNTNQLKTTTKLTLSFSNEDLVSADAKMRHQARCFNRRAHGHDIHAIQDAPPMTPRYFRKVMNRVFHMGLSKPEGDALFSVFDADCGGDVDGSEFLSKFFKFHKEEHLRVLREEKEEMELKALMAEEVQKELEREKQEQLATEMAGFTVKDVKSAIDKITAAAQGYDPSKCNIDSFKGGADMGPQDFRQELKGTFGMKITLPELGVLFYMFDDDGGGTIERSEFMSLFFKLRRNDPDTIEAVEILGCLTEEELEPARATIKETFTETDNESSRRVSTLQTERKAPKDPGKPQGRGSKAVLQKGGSKFTSQKDIFKGHQFNQRSSQRDLMQQATERSGRRSLADLETSELLESTYAAGENTLIREDNLDTCHVQHEGSGISSEGLSPAMALKLSPEATISDAISKDNMTLKLPRL